ncbi:oligosaccharide flippase family protein [Mangrovibacter phragmitis]|uniref:oligosaccharide flippase family protein n=1 Tax=Mangrovibacter phragmitis TaxID=1691903 RepID=UPI003518F2CC
MKSSRQVYSNIISLVFVQLSNYLAPLMVFPYLSRVLGVDGFGLVVIALSVAAISFIFTDFGFNLSAPYWIVKNRGDKNEVAKFIGAIFILKGVILLFVTSSIYIYFVFSNSPLSKINNVIPCIFFVVFTQAFLPVWFFQGIEKMKGITFFWVTAKLFYLASVLVFVKHPGQEQVVLFCLGLSNFIAVVIGIFAIYREGYTIRLPTRMMVSDAFKHSFQFFLSRAAVGLYTGASTFIVGAFGGVQQAALYSSSEKLYQAGQSLTSPVSQALYPYLSRTSDARALYKFIGICLIPMIIGCGVCFYYAREILIIFYGAKFNQAELILRVFLICSVINFIGVNFGYPAFAIINRLDIANRTVLFASIMYAIVLMFLYYIDMISARNVAIGVCSVEFIVMLARVSCFTFLYRKLNIK